MYLHTARRHGARAQPPCLAEGQGSASEFQELRLPSRRTLYSRTLTGRGKVKVKCEGGTVGATPPPVHNTCARAPSCSVNVLLEGYVSSCPTPPPRQRVAFDNGPAAKGQRQRSQLRQLRQRQRSLLRQLRQRQLSPPRTTTTAMLHDNRATAQSLDCCTTTERPPEASAAARHRATVSSLDCCTTPNDFCEPRLTNSAMRLRRAIR